jgi:hypothetical protein
MTKFNKGSMSNYFPFKQHRFDTTQHPVVTTDEKVTSAVFTLLSVDEARMMSGLSSVLQVSERDAVRIALYEACRADENGLELTRPYSDPFTKKRGHTDRKKKTSVKCSKSEKNQMIQLAKELGVSEKEVIRLAIIWLAKGIKEETIRHLTKSKKIGQKKLSQKWNEDNKGSGKKTILKPLLSARDASAERTRKKAQELYDQRGEMMDVMFASSQGGKAFLLSEDWKPNLEEVDDAITDEVNELIRQMLREENCETDEDALECLTIYYLSTGMEQEVAEVMAMSWLQCYDRTEITEPKTSDIVVDDITEERVKEADSTYQKQRQTDHEKQQRKEERVRERQKEWAEMSNGRKPFRISDHH